ncbi:hypothetical protein D6833_06285, partial [Candidatus Parcubacteria bacterium]
MKGRRGFRVRGPYPHGRRWRVDLAGPQGERIVESFGTLAEAEAAAAAARAAISQGVSVAELAEKYLRELASTARPGTVQTERFRLRIWLGGRTTRDFTRR